MNDDTKKAKAFDIIKNILTYDNFISLNKSFDNKFYCIQVRRKFDTQTIYITEEEFNILKEVLNDE